MKSFLQNIDMHGFFFTDSFTFLGFLSGKHVTTDFHIIHTSLDEKIPF